MGDPDQPPKLRMNIRFKEGEKTPSAKDALREELLKTKSVESLQKLEGGTLVRKSDGTRYSVIGIGETTAGVRTVRIQREGGIGPEFRPNANQFFSELESGEWEIG